MKTTTKQVRFNAKRGSFAELRSFHDMSVRGIGVLADVSDGLFGGKGQRRATSPVGLSGRPTATVFPTAA